MEGVYMTKAELAAWLKEDWRHGIWFRVDNNPTGVYELIKANYSSDEFRNLTSGSEKSVGSKEMMQAFLEEKAQQDPKGPEAYAVFIYVAIPHDLDTDNWTNEIK